MHRHYTTFGQRIRTLRIAKGYTLREFARLLDVSPTYVSQIEQDKFNPPAEERIVRMSALFGLDADELLAHAGRVADDLPAIIRREPRALATFLRTANGLSADAITRLTQQAQDLQHARGSNDHDDPGCSLPGQKTD
ncbi:MAG: XRE family transcriptional regulator [Planctomycetota bacterium]|nr:MAG: XRE family transcriptional regulator [Planctomycetota bacterium]